MKGEKPCLKKRPFFATAPFSHNTIRSNFIEGLGLLTTARVGDIRFPLSWRLRALIMGIGKTARKPRQYRLIRAKGPVNQWLGVTPLRTEVQDVA
jgi:hypothetical protein